MGDAPGHQEPARVLAGRRVLRPAGLSRSFLILHGLEGSGPEHWQTWLAVRLRERGEAVSYPDLPEPFDPQPKAWLAAMRAELDAMDGERVVLCHSLACLLWMLHARDHDGRRADRVLLVAPPCAWDIAPVARFRPEGVTQSDIQEAAARTEGICSTGDPYCTEGAAGAFPFLDLEVLSDAGHLNTDAGYGPWPAVERWALGQS